VWGLYLTWLNTWRHSSCCTQCALTPDFIPPMNSPDLNPVDYSFWSIMQEKVYQTHIANIDELKDRLVQMWAELDHRHIAAAIEQRWRRLSACDSCAKAQGGIFWTAFALNLHVAFWAICWIVGLCNIWHLTLLPADFECFVSYYSRFCVFCVWYGFNSSYYHINKHLRIYAIRCHAWIIPEQSASKIVKISQQMAKLWRKLKWLVFFWDTVYSSFATLGT